MVRRRGFVRIGLLALHPFLPSLQARIGHARRHQPNRANGIVVARNRVIDLVRITVGIDDGHNGNLEPPAFVYRNRLVLGIDNENRPWEMIHIPNTPQVVVELFTLLGEFDALVLGKQVDGPIVVNRVEVVQAFNALADRLEISEHSAEPAVLNIEHFCAVGLFVNGFLGLLLGSDKKNRSSGGRCFHYKIISGFEHFDGLLQIDDIDPVTSAKDIRFHLRVPPLRLVAEMHPSFKQFLHADIRHFHSPFISVLSAAAVIRTPSSNSRGTGRWVR